MNAQYWIEHLELLEHPEGGYFRETYRSADAITESGLPGRFSGSHAVSTAIYFLVLNRFPSRLHRLKSDEIWHFYEGDPITLSLLHPDKRLETIRLGRNPDNGEVFQATVPAGCWFGGTVEAPGSYALVGCTVAPGFDFTDFELGTRSRLLPEFPEHADTIEMLAVSDESN